MLILLSAYALLYSLHLLTKKNALVYHTCVESLSFAICTYLYINDLSHTCIQYIWCITRYIYVIRVEPMTTSSMIHHFSSIVLLLLCYHVNLHNFALKGLTLTSISTPFIALSKMLRSFGREKQALLAFVPFTILYIISRIFMFPFMLCIPIYYLDTSWTIWIASNMSINIIYALQFYWLAKILHILSKKCLEVFIEIGYSIGI